MNKLKKEIFKIDYKNILTLIFSIFSGAIIIFGNNIIYNGEYYAKYKDITINNISFPEFILFIIFSIGIYIIINYINLNIYKKHQFFENKNIKMSLKLFLIIFLLFILAWSPYILSYYPGGIYSDFFTSMNQALFLKIDNHHTLLYSYYVSIFAHLGKIINNYNITLFIYTIIQYLFMAYTLSIVIKWLYNKGIKKCYLIFITLVFLFFPLFPYYAIAGWKDTYFSLFLLLYILFIIDYITGNIDFSKKRNIIKFISLSFFVCFLRNNGIYVVAFTLFCLIMFNIKNIKKNKLFIIVDSIFIIITFIIQGPVYDKFGLSGEYEEKLGIPMQQVGAIISAGKYTKNDVKVISKIWDLNEVKEQYTPYLADTMKWYIKSFDRKYLINHKKEFRKEWINLVKKNPDIATRAYLLETLGYWNIRYSSNIAYIQEGVWENFYNVKQHDYFYDLFNFSFANIVKPVKYISSGLLFLIVMLFMIVSLKRKGLKSVVGFAPIIGLWITIMIATPTAFSLRYVYILVLIIPISFLLPEILEDTV